MMCTSFESEAAKLRESSQNRSRWVSLNRAIVEQTASRQFGKYRCTLLTMGDILRKGASHSQSLDTYLEVCYLDANGPMDFDSKATCEFQPFQPHHLMVEICDIVAGYVEQLMEQLALSIRDLRSRFLGIAARQQRLLDCPVAPEIAWRELSDKLMWPLKWRDR
jgi:hypothetical protein